MKSNTPTIALSSTLRDQKMVQNLFSRYYNIDVTKGSKLELSYSPDIDPARILILPTKEAINRIMSGDVSYCIARLKDMQECFAGNGKIPITDQGSISGFGYKDEAFVQRIPITKLVGDGRGENGTEDANRFRLKPTGEYEETLGRVVPLYTVPFLIDDRAYGEEVAADDFPAGVTSLRTMRKNPNVELLTKSILQTTASLYETSSYFRNKYPRG